MKPTCHIANRLVESTGTKLRNRDLCLQAFRALGQADSRMVADWVNKHYQNITFDEYEARRRAVDLEAAQEIRVIGKIGKSRRGNPATMWAVAGEVKQANLFQ